MNDLALVVRLESDATFAGLGGVPGVVDVEIRTDEAGLPYLTGRDLKGVLVESCAEILHALELQHRAGSWAHKAGWLFGNPGSAVGDGGHLRVGRGRLPADLVSAVRRQVLGPSPTLARSDVVESLTAVRRQTAVNETGAPRQETLRSVRVLIRGLAFYAPLRFTGNPDPAALALLAACVMGLRRMGAGRTRGRGRIEASLMDSEGRDQARTLFGALREELST